MAYYALPVPGDPTKAPPFFPILGKDHVLKSLAQLVLILPIPSSLSPSVGSATSTSEMDP